MAKVIAGVLAALCGAIIITTGDVSLLSSQPETVRTGVAALGNQPLLYTIALALPFVLPVWSIATGGSLTKGASAAWMLYGYFAFMAFSGAVEFASAPLYLNPYALPMMGFVLVLLAEKSNESVATPAPVVGEPTLPPSAAPERGRGKGGR